MSGSDLRRALEALIAGEEEFRRLDAAAGDGDLGITVRGSALAALEWLQAHPASPAGSVLAGLAGVCASTNPSTFASLVSRGLAAAARSLEGSDGGSGGGDDDGVAAAAGALEAGIAMVRRRGGAVAGEKTFLDALEPALGAMRGAASVREALAGMRLAAAHGTEQTMGDLGQHGRAAWVGERARGVPDAGCVVVIRFLEALEGAAAVPWSATLPDRPADDIG
jgi:hypothetical protein